MNERRRARVAFVIDKRPAPLGEAVMYRDAEYGALVLERADGGISEFDFGFIEEDAKAARAVLSRYARRSVVSGTEARWVLDRDAHALAVLSTLQQEMRIRGYEGDKLAERATIIVKPGEVRRPDLPAEGKVLVHEAIDAGIRQRIALVSAAVRGTTPTLRYYPRPHASLGTTRTPFAVARFFVESAGRNAATIRDKALQAIGDWRDHLVKLAVTEGAQLGVEIGLSLPSPVCESLMGDAVPIFEYSNITGARVVTFDIENPLTEEERRDIEALGRACSGCVRVAQEGLRLAVQIPSGVDGNYGADYALHERLSWVCRVLQPWGARLDDIGPLHEIDLTPATRKADLRECGDDEMPQAQGGDAAQAAAMANGDVVATLASRFAQMPPAWWDTPQGEDALKKAKKLIKDEHGEEDADRFEKQLELLRLTSGPTVKAEGLTEGSVGETIFNQIKAGATDRYMLGSWGAKNFQGTPTGIQFDVSGAKFKGRVIVNYNKGHDLYDIELGRVRNYEWHSVKSVSGIDAENLAHVLDSMIETGKDESVQEDAPGAPLDKAALGRTMLKAAGTFVPAQMATLDGSDDEEEKNRDDEGGEDEETSDDEEEKDEEVDERRVIRGRR